MHCMHFSNAPLKLFWKTYLLPANFSAFFFFLNLLYVLSVNALNYHNPLCLLHLLWKEVCALSFKRDRRQHAVWETGWKSASVNTPRPHVLPGQKGWLLSRHICTQSLSSQRVSQGDRAGQRRERRREREKRSQTGRTCLLCEKYRGVSDESDDIWLKETNKTKNTERAREKWWNLKYRQTKIYSLFEKEVKICGWGLTTIIATLCICITLLVHMPRSAWLQSLLVSLREDGLLHRQSCWLSRSYSLRFFNVCMPCAFMAADACDFPHIFTLMYTFFQAHMHPTSY